METAGGEAKAKAKGPRKRHVQQELFRRGGKRKGAGRKPKGARAGASHEARPDFESKHPLHIVLRVVPQVGSLRRRQMYKAVREASLIAAMRGRIRIIHISVQATHLHMLVEARSKQALALGMQGFQVSLARHINTLLGPDKLRRRRGRVFADRYHLVVIRSPRQARNALSYVLSNWRKHQEDRWDQGTRDCVVRTGRPSTWLVDPFSSGSSFTHWQELEGDAWMWRTPDDYDPLIVYQPRTWLLREGWKRHGPISAHAVPSKRP